MQLAIFPNFSFMRDNNTKIAKSTIKSVAESYHTLYDIPCTSEKICVYTVKANPKTPKIAKIIEGILSKIPFFTK